MVMGKGGAIKGFFFDLDGTLVDTHESNFRAYKQAIMETTDVEPDSELKERIKSGESSVDFLPRIVPDITSEQVDIINKRKKEVYPEHLYTSQLNDYLSNFLEQMSEHYVTVLVTTAKRYNAEAVLAAHDLGGYFNFAIFGEDVETMKPNPEAYLLALKKSGLGAEEVIAFEDSEKGIEAARAAGISTIHIRNFL